MEREDENVPRPAEADAPASSPEPTRSRLVKPGLSVEIVRARLTRRRLLAGTATGVAVGAVVLPLTPIGMTAQDAPATPAATPVAATPDAQTRQAEVTLGETAGQPMQPPIGLEFFNPYEGAVLQAAAARIVPTDENGPGAYEAGVVYFIDRQLAGMYGFSAQRYNRGPYAQGQPTQGDQSPLTLRDRFRLGLAALDAYAQHEFGGAFFSLPPEQQDKLLTDLQNDTPKPFSATALKYQPFDQAAGSTLVDEAVQSGIGAAAFFQQLLQYTIAGFFSDPAHGGNQDLIGWKLIGFPGGHMDYADHILNYGQPYTGPFITLADDQLSMSGGI